MPTDMGEGSGPLLAMLLIAIAAVGVSSWAKADQRALAIRHEKKLEIALSELNIRNAIVKDRCGKLRVLAEYDELASRAINQELTQRPIFINLNAFRTAVTREFLESVAQLKAPLECEGVTLEEMSRRMQELKTRVLPEKKENISRGVPWAPLY